MQPWQWVDSADVAPLACGTPPVVPPPVALTPEPLSAQERLESVELKVLQAELESLKTAMTGAMIAESTPPAHELSESAVNEMEEHGVAKAQLRVLLGMQARMVESYQAQRKSLQVSIIVYQGDWDLHQASVPSC